MAGVVLSGAGWEQPGRNTGHGFSSGGDMRGLENEREWGRGQWTFFEKFGGVERGIYGFETAGSWGCGLGAMLRVVEWEFRHGGHGFLGFVRWGVWNLPDMVSDSPVDSEYILSRRSCRLSTLLARLVGRLVR